MSLDLSPVLEAEIEKRAAAEGVSVNQLIDSWLHYPSPGKMSIPIRSVDPANDTSISLLLRRIAAAPTDPGDVRRAEEDLAEPESLPRIR